MKFDDLFLAAERAGEKGDNKKSLELWSEALDELIVEARDVASKDKNVSVPSEDKKDLFPEYFESLKHLLRADDRASAVSNNMGIIFFGDKDYSGAIRFFKQAVDLCPAESVELMFAALRNLGMALFEEGEAEEALKHFETALLLRPDEEAARRGAELCKKLIETAKKIK